MGKDCLFTLILHSVVDLDSLVRASLVAVFGGTFVRNLDQLLLDKVWSQDCPQDSPEDNSLIQEGARMVLETLGVVGARLGINAEGEIYMTRVWAPGAL